MATMPIEIIVQDAEAPVVPGEDGTNTNTNTEATVAVPDTGSGIGNVFTGSTSSIVLPAILLILAIGSIVTILIHKYHKQKKNKASKKEKLAVATTSTIAVLAATVLVGNLVIPATKAAISDTTDTITPAEDKVSIVVTRDGCPAETSIESTATITSTSDFGYKVLLSMAEGVETSNLYLDGDTTSQYYIASVEVENEEGVELADNTWGFALTEDGGYSAMPLLDNAATVAEGDGPVEDELLSIYYGVKVSSDLPAGTYSGGEIEYNLVALEPTISDLSYMQDFAKLSESGKASVLRSMTEDEQYTLKDSRDKKDYFIAKLKDGNVWMTQNLDLDIEVPAEGSTVYDSTNTNLPANTTWEPERATIAKGNLSSDTWQVDDNDPYSYDPGDVYYYTSGSDADDTKYESLEACTGANHTEAECRHYHAGNYYNWTAAIASNDSSGYTEEYQNAATSICPAGWRLPIINSAALNDNEFATLVGSYGILGDSMPCGPGCSSKYGYTVNGFNSIRLTPIWLVRPGSINRYATVDVFNAGRYGEYWSSGAMGSTAAVGFEFSFNDGMGLPASNSRNKGSSVRCVAE